MEHSRRGEGNDHTSQPSTPVGKADQHLTTEPPVPGASAGDLSDLEDLDMPMIPGYLALEEDLEALSLEFSELFDPEASTIPGYLTLESDLDALADDPPWKSPNSAESNEPRGKP